MRDSNHKLINVDHYFTMMPKNKSPTPFDSRKLTNILGIVFFILAFFLYMNGRGYASFEILEVFDKGTRRDDTMALVETIFAGFLLVSGSILIKY